MKKNTIHFRMYAVLFAAGLLVFHMMLPPVEVSATESDFTAGELPEDNNGQMSQPITTQTGQMAAGAQTDTDAQAATGVTSVDVQTGADTQMPGVNASDVPDADTSDMPDENRVDETTSMPEWTDRLVTGRGETEDGFSGSGLDVRQLDADYEGELDAVTGTPVTSGAQQRQTTGRIQLSDKMYYDFDHRGYIFHSPRFGIEIGANVADGMVTNERVVIVVPDGVTTSLYKDGNVVERPALSALSEPGGYVLRIGNGSEN